MKSPQSKVHKHLRVYSALHQAIATGRWTVGDRLPSEAALVQQFGVSRITVGRAVKDLQAAGLVERRAGAGTFVKRVQRSGALSFGLLIPELGETEIFEPICRGIMDSPLAREHALVWGDTGGLNSSKEDRARQLCRQYIERRVIWMTPEFRSCCSTERCFPIRSRDATIWWASTTGPPVTTSPTIC